MRAALSRCCAFGVALVAFAALAAPALADTDVPTGLTAVAQSDHEVDLTWSWPASPTYPDDLQVWRNGVEVTSVSQTSTSFVDVAPAPDTTYSYKLVTVTGGVPTSTASVPAKTRADLPNAPTGVAVSFAPGTNIATVTWTRGAMDADVTYNVSAQQVGSSNAPITTTQHYAAGNATAGSVTMDNFLSFASYSFTVSAVEAAGDPPSDPGGAVAAPAVPAQANDVIAPVFSSAVATAQRQSVGSVLLSWPSASDAGSGVKQYDVCLDAVTPCSVAPYNPLATSEQFLVTGVPDDGADHLLTVSAVDQSGNRSVVIPAHVTMPVLAPPAISLAPGLGDGCTTLSPVLTPPAIDGSQVGMALYVNGAPWPVGSAVTGPPYSVVQLQAIATFGLEASDLSPAIGARIGDPDPPTEAPVLRVSTDTTANTASITWNPITAVGAPVVNYAVVSKNVPGFTGQGSLVGLSTTPSVFVGGLDQNTTYSLTVAALDACGRPGPSTPINFLLSDTTPPTAPKNLRVSPSTSSVTLSWGAATDNVQVEGYEVWRNGTKLPGEVPGTTFTDAGLTDATSFTYKVRAVDTAGRTGPFTDPQATATLDGTPPGPTGTPIPTKVGAHEVSLRWTPAIDNSGAIAKYLVTRSTNGGAPVQIGSPTAPKFTDANVPAGSNTWTVVAVDAAGNQSKSRSTISPITAAAVIKPLQATSVQLSGATGVRLLRYGGKSGSRMLLTFTLKSTVVPAQLNLRVLSGTAKVKVSLPLGKTGSTPGKRLAERRAKKGVLEIPLGKMPQGKLRLIVTASQGKMVTLTAPKAAKKPTLSQK